MLGTTAAWNSRGHHQRPVPLAVLPAFAGAQGVVLSRKYSEMQLDHLAGAGDAIRELQRSPLFSTENR